MSNQLQNILDEIKVEKDSKLLPENIKKGVQIFDITGTLEQGEASADAPVKLFETIEDMQNDLTAKENDLAVVYRNEINNATVDSQFQVAKFQTTVVLPQAMSDYVEVRYRAVDNSIMFDCWGSLDSSRFMMECYTESGSIRIQYTSTDGITYTRTDGGEEVIDFGTEIKYDRPEYWNDVIGYFIQLGGSTFEGLYEYTHGKDYDDFNAITNIEISYTTDKLSAESFSYNIKYIRTSILNQLAKLIKPLKTEVRDILVEQIDDDTYNLHISHADRYTISTSFITKYYDDGDTNLYSGIISSSSEVWSPYVYKVILSQNSIEDITSSFTIETITTTMDSTTKICKYITTPINTSHVWTTINCNSDDITDGAITLGSKVTYSDGGSIYVVSGTIPTTISEKTQYFIAPTQLTLSNANQLLPGAVGYGKNGLVEGDTSVYDNISVSEVIKYSTDNTKYNDYATVYTDKDITGLSIIDKSKLDLSNAVMTKKYYSAQEFYDFPDTYYFNQRMTEHYYVEMGLVNSVLKVRVWDLDFNLLLSKDLSGDYIFGSSDLITAEDSTGTRIAYASAPFVSADSKAYIVSGWIDLNTQEITYNKVANASGNGLALTIDKDDNYYVLSSATNYYSVGTNIVINGEKWLQITTSSYCYGNTPTIGIADGYLYISSTNTDYVYDIYNLANKTLVTRVDAYLSNRFIQDDTGNYYLLGRLTSESPITALYKLANGGFEETEYVFSTYTSGTAKALKVSFLDDKGYILSGDLKCYCSDGTTYNVALESTSGKFINNSGTLTNNGKTLRFVDKVDNGAMVRQLHLDKGFGETNSIKFIIDNDDSADTAKDYLMLNTGLQSYEGTISPTEYSAALDTVNEILEEEVEE